MTCWSNVFDRLAIHQPEAPAAPRFNPNPPGTIHKGAASEAVLALLSENSGRRWLTAGEIIAGTGKTVQAVSWALLFLRANDLIEVVPDYGRNSRYLRYAIPQGGER